MNLKEKKILNPNNKDYKRLLKHYRFTSEDENNLKEIETITKIYSKEFLDGFYKFIFEFDYARKFLYNQEIIQRHKIGIENWYLNLFCGQYNKIYFEKLYMISEIHVRIGLPAHYVNAAFSYVRDFVKKILLKEKKYNVLSSVDKIIDINLDILTISYQEEEQSKLLNEIAFLKNAVDNSNIEPYIQGIFDTKTLKIKKYESLMRLVDSKSKEVFSVFPFLEISKKIKLYEKMMQIMVDKTFALFSNQNIEFSINLSYEDIANESFMEFLYKKINSYKNPENIIFEIL